MFRVSGHVCSVIRVKVCTCSRTFAVSRGKVTKSAMQAAVPALRNLHTQRRRNIWRLQTHHTDSWNTHSHCITTLVIIKHMTALQVKRLDTPTHSLLWLFYIFSHENFYKNTHERMRITQRPKHLSQMKTLIFELFWTFISVLHEVQRMLWNDWKHYAAHLLHTNANSRLFFFH